jgi:hypothetical protein
VAGWDILQIESTASVYMLKLTSSSIGIHQHKKSFQKKMGLGEKPVYFFFCADFLQKTGNCVFAKIMFLEKPLFECLSGGALFCSVYILAGPSFVVFISDS